MPPGTPGREWELVDLPLSAKSRPRVTQNRRPEADILFFRHYFWLRLIVNVGIVLVFGAFYLRFLKRPMSRR